MANIKLYSCSTCLELAHNIAEYYGGELGGLEIKRFADGEIFPHFTESIRGYDIHLIQSTYPPADNLLELLLTTDAARRASANSISLIIPYFGYARQDSKDRPRVAIGARLVANLISAAGADRVITCDLHAGQIQGFFNIPVDNLQSATVFVPYVQSLNLDNFIFVSPDAGGVPKARAFAKYFGVDIAFCNKYREKANEVASIQVIGRVKDRDVIIVDDMVDTAGTLCKAAETLKAKGAKSVRAICTHPVLSNQAWQKIENSVIEELVVTDTIPLRPAAAKVKKIKVLSLARLFSKTIRKISDQESVSSLYI